MCFQEMIHLICLAICFRVQFVLSQILICVDSISIYREGRQGWFAVCGRTVPVKITSAFMSVRLIMQGSLSSDSFSAFCLNGTVKLHFLK